MSYRFACKQFTELSIHELYDILNLRNEVFVLEQNCVFVDTDYKDQKAWHLMLYNEDSALLGYTRLIPEGISYPNYTSIGRVVNHPAFRNQGVGKLIMEKSIDMVYELFGKNYSIKIGAQLYLEKFYESFGFKRVGDVYDEDGIDHIHMIKA
jgi:ElaA protein